jgi:hypothetical protein
VCSVYPVPPIVYSNDICNEEPSDFHVDVVRPSNWLKLPIEIDVIMSSGPFEIYDCMALDFIRRSKVACILHTPADWLANGPLWRRQAFARFQDAGLMVQLAGLPRSSYGRRCIFIIVFKSLYWRNELWRPGSDYVCSALF